jgi:hypothetical protein
MQAGQAAEEPDQVRLGSIEARRCRRFTILDGMIVVRLAVDRYPERPSGRVCE